ncbi:Phosphatidylinositol 4-kinase beta [Arachis hypogaea]|nr:Phosphatidylinositol 4-kinase beta [Arachis hypogaea]
MIICMYIFTYLNLFHHWLLTPICCCFCVLTFKSLAEINLHLTEAQNTGGVCFPLGKGMYRVLYIPEDEAVLLNSRENAPYMICVEVLRCDMIINSKDTSSPHKLSKGGIPLANGDALLPKPPPWAYPLWTTQEAAAAKGEAPLGLPLKGAGQDSSDAQSRVRHVVEVLEIPKSVLSTHPFVLTTLSSLNSEFLSEASVNGVVGLTPE